MEKRPFYRAFLSVFPNCVHLQCSLHKWENLLRKLHELKFDEVKVKQILLDVFGSWIDDTYFEGLIDSADYKDFMEKLKMLHTEWESLCPGFIDWFTGMQAEVMCSTMIASLHTRAGLCNPLGHFTMNSNESLNNILKRKVDFNVVNSHSLTKHCKLLLRNNRMNLRRPYLVQENISQQMNLSIWKYPPQVDTNECGTEETENTEGMHS